MKTKILELLKKQKRALLISEINDLFGLKTVSELKKLMTELTELEKKGIIYHTKRDKYVLIENTHLKIGKLAVHKKGFGFVLMVNEPDIRINATNMNGAIHNDLVAVEIIRANEGKVIKIVNRELDELIGEYYQKNGKGYVKLDDPRYRLNIEIEPNENKGAVEGHKVLVKIKKKLENDKYQATILKILGHKNDPGVDILCVIYQHGIKNEFSEEVLNETEVIPSIVREEDLKGRRDLRRECIFTIDGEDAKDLDDAISIDKLDNDNYKLGVHIADVSYYVKENSFLDKEAYERGTSVYLVDRVVPMLPHKLANGICSLNENVDRLTITCEMEINQQGNIIDYDIFESVINSEKRMTYKDVNKILEKNEIASGYEPFVNKLIEMKNLADILRENKIKRGFIDFDLDEMKIIVNDEGVPIDIGIRERGIGEKIIEDFMIVANETVATHIANLDLPFVYRVHEYPKEKKIRSFIELINLMGYKINAKPKNFYPKDVQKILEELKEKKEFPVLSSLLLRSMQKAIYESENVGHYGLASKCYTHFTSPIRRYPDTTVHRLLRTYIFEQKINNKTTQHWEEKLTPLCEHASLKENDAVECEREVESLKAAEYMEQHIGEKYEGIIAGMINIGMFVQLDNLVEGLVHISELGNDSYHFDEKTMSIVGRKNNNRYRLGERVLVEVINASKQEKTIDFKVLQKIK